MLQGNLFITAITAIGLGLALDLSCKEGAFVLIPHSGT